MDPVTAPGPRSQPLAAYLGLGVLFGVILVKSEVVSWFRIQEMFRFDSFHMFGIIGSAVLTARLSIVVLRRLHARALTGEPLTIPPKARGHRYWMGGTIFGLGWATTGACPGPMVALVGAGVEVYLVVALSALVGTWVYGYLRPKLPH
jgi:uncharacterized membrane protein YedE/YeeE